MLERSQKSTAANPVRLGFVSVLWMGVLDRTSSIQAVNSNPFPVAAGEPPRSWTDRR